MKKAELKNIEIKSVSPAKVVMSVSYSYVPYGGDSPLTSRQEFRFSLWEKADKRRIYIDGGYDRLGYWDLDKETWYPQVPKQKYLEDIITETVKLAIEEMKKEKARIERVRARARRSL